MSSPVRAWAAVGGEPLFVERGEGAYLHTTDGRRLLDVTTSFGPLILGHAHPKVVDAIREAARRGTTYGAPTEAETELVELLVEHVPSIEMARLVNSGTEATMSAIRLARAATGRDLVVKFAGGYHGHADHLLVQAGSGVATLGIPGTPGVPEAFAGLTAVLAYNSIDGAEEFFAAHGYEVAAVIVEPVAGNMGVVPGETPFLEALRRLCDQCGALLIFDEVITGFRLGLGGAQAMFSVTPDLTCLGKIIGGGLPLAAYGGGAWLMSQLAPEGRVYQAGTLSGNPIATAAGLATLRVLVDELPYARLDEAAARLQAALLRAAEDAGVPMCINRVGSMLTPFFTRALVSDYDSARTSDTAAYAAFFHHLVAAGVYPPPSQFEAWFMSTAMADGPIDELLEAIASA